MKLNHWIGLDAQKKPTKQPAPGPVLMNSTIFFIKKLREQLKPFHPWPHIKDEITASLRVESLLPPNQQVLIQVWLAVTDGYQHVALFRISLYEIVCGMCPAVGKEKISMQR